MLLADHVRSGRGCRHSLCGSPEVDPVAAESRQSPFLGIQTVVESPKDFKVEKMIGEVKPRGSIAGKIVGSWNKTKWNLDFDVKLPAKEASAGVGCGQ